MPQRLSVGLVLGVDREGGWAEVAQSGHSVIEGWQTLEAF